MSLHNFFRKLSKFWFNKEKISKVWLCEMPSNSSYIKPKRLHYIENGIEKTWDVLKIHDHVAIIIFNITRQVLIFVRQFRPAVYHHTISKEGKLLENVDLTKFPASLGVTLEFCAGIADKEKKLKTIAKEEIMEECGYAVDEEHIEKVFSYRSGVRTSSALQNLYYCEVRDAQKVSVNDFRSCEAIEVVEYTIPETEQLIKQGGHKNSPVSFNLGLMWFLRNKATKQAKKI